jgi:hypothetical protein
LLLISHVHENMSSRRTVSFAVTSFINYVTDAQLFTILCLIKVMEMLGGSAIIQLDSMGRMTVSLGRTLSGFACRWVGTKSTKMVQWWLFPGPSFVRGLMQGILVHMVIQIDRMD